MLVLSPEGGGGGNGMDDYMHDHANISWGVVNSIELIQLILSLLIKNNVKNIN